MFPECIRTLLLTVLASAVLVLAGCASSAVLQKKTDIRARPSIDSLLAEKISGLDYRHITESDIRDILSRAPAPRIINLNGSIPLVTMDSFSKFLIGMGYPEEQVCNPLNGDFSYSSYMSSEKLAGYIAWYYERDGLMPLLIGHSQGGMLVIRTLHELSGAFHERLRVWNPLTGEPEDRYSIIDPLTGRECEVRDLKVGYASAVATGKTMRLILGQWDMLGRLREIPDSVEEFVGVRLTADLIGGDMLSPDKAGRYHPLGSAIVRNVKLPAGYGHLTVPLVRDLAGDNAAREWLNRYIPGTEELLSQDELFENGNNMLFAAEQWFYIKKYWSKELQRLALSRRGKN